MPDKWVCTLTCSSSNKALVCTMHALTAQAKQARAGGKGGAAAAVPSGDDEIMKKVFLNYCKYTVGQGRSTYDENDPKMSSTQFVKLCQDLGLVQPNGEHAVWWSLHCHKTTHKVPYVLSQRIVRWNGTE